VKTFLKLLLVAAVLNGVYRFGVAEYKFSQLKDATHTLLVMGTRTPPEQVKDQIVAKSSELGLSVSPGRVLVSRNGMATTATVAYRHPVEVFPGVPFPREYSFTDSIVPIR
jgi:hypothetical protein